jgi:uncharacterized membrane protein YozB (DUF420 family)
MTVQDLPTLNACLNATSGVLLIIGYVLIRRGQRKGHGWVMGSAFAVSVVFLASYLTYHYKVGHVVYEGEGTIRTIYLSILLTHVVLAALVVPLVLRTVYLAWRRRWDKHRWWGKLTLPIWIYVSVTGVVVYFMLYG